MTQPIRVFVPRETAALSLGADEVADAIMREAERRNELIELVRNGSWGLSWAEPLVEVDTANGRIAYGSITETDVSSLFDAGFLNGQPHTKCLGPTSEIPYLKNQERLTFVRCGAIDPVSLEDYEAHGGFRGAQKALARSPAQIVAAVTESGLRGRGGAGFPTGIKWKTVLEQTAEQKYIVCNADEGDSGTFSDRILMESDPFCLIEGMLIAGLAVGATQGFIYLRSEYPLCRDVLSTAILKAEGAGWLGENIKGSGKSFEIKLRMGAGAYICGEESSLLESLEGKRGQVRARPPLPAIEGLFGRPTVVNNVVSLASVLIILDKGADYYRDFGVGRSLGTLAFQLTGNIKRGGLVEKAFGLTLRDLIETFGQGTGSGRPLRAVQVGGPLGAYFPDALLDTPMDYESFAEVGGMLGHGGIVVFDDTVDMGEQARFAMEFCAIESCGKCTPCRIGSVRGVEVIDRILNNQNRAENMELLTDLCETLRDGSLCAMGGLTPNPVESALKHFPEDFSRREGQGVE